VIRQCEPKTRMPVKCIRYCDDTVICCRYRSDAKDILKVFRGRLQKVFLKLNDAKTKLVRFVLNLKWFKQKGLITLDSFTERNPRFKFGH